MQPQLTDSGMIMTGEFLGTFVHVFEMLEFEGSKPEYSIEMVFEPNDPTIALMTDVIKQTAQEKWGNNLPPNFKVPIRDGNMKSLKYPELANKYVVKASDKNRKPVVIDRNAVEILDSSAVYSGAKYRAVVDAYAYETRGSYGVAFGLKVLQKLADGEPLSGGGIDQSKIKSLMALPGGPTQGFVQQQPTQGIQQQPMQQSTQGFVQQQQQPTQGFVQQQPMQQSTQGFVQQQQQPTQQQQNEPFQPSGGIVDLNNF